MEADHWRRIHLCYSIYSLTADMFAKDSVHDAPETLEHARCLDSGFLAALEVLNASDYSRIGTVAQRLRRGVADAAPMASLCCLLFHNLCDDKDASKASPGMSFVEDAARPHPKRRWKMHKDRFLYGLMRCAGRRHACNVVTSGCVSSRNTLRRQRSSSFADWDEQEGSENEQSSARTSDTPPVDAASGPSKRSPFGLTAYAKSLRPMIVLYAIFDQLSADFSLTMDDELIEQCSQRLATLIRSCIQSENIEDLISKAGITVDHKILLKEFLEGMNS